MKKTPLLALGLQEDHEHDGKGGQQQSKEHNNIE
jgi:hypothetical protein